MTKFEKAEKLQKRLNEIERASKSLRTIYDEMMDEKEYENKDYGNRSNDEIRYQQRVANIISDICDSFSHCYSAIRGLKPDVDKAWHDFYAQEYEEEGEEND